MGVCAVIGGGDGGSWWLGVWKGAEAAESVKSGDAQYTNLQWTQKNILKRAERNDKGVYICYRICNGNSGGSGGGGGGGSDGRSSGGANDPIISQIFWEIMNKWTFLHGVLVDINNLLFK